MVLQSSAETKVSIGKKSFSFFFFVLLILLNENRKKVLFHPKT